MAGETLELRNFIEPDQLGTSIANQWVSWHGLRSNKLAGWEEIRRYVFATDTRSTSNSSLPWKNTTTVPKLCQIRDNLYAFYMAALFPNSKRQWLTWEADDDASNDVQKAKSILAYARYMISQNVWKKEIGKLVLDYIDYGNCFSTVEWVDNRVELEDKQQVGYVGPVPKRISPLDIVFNPIASSFQKSPKIVRSIISLGELKAKLESLSIDENNDLYKKLFDYLYNLRSTVRSTSAPIQEKDSLFAVDGFASFRAYLESDYVELLTFYGDLYDHEHNTFLRNHMITVVDRHKVMVKKPNPSFFGYPPIFHSGWRIRQDNLWAMGPLDNLVGMQYRIDHIENLKADAFDMNVAPPIKIKGYVEDFGWGPFERIYVGDDGDVTPMPPSFEILKANIEISGLQSLMEEMAGSPKEAMGFRTPGEKTAYEVQRLENAANRIFTNKTAQFEENQIEPILNAQVEMARRTMNTAQSIRVFNDEFKINEFVQLSPEDITGAGRIRPIAARHFAEKAEQVQNLNAFLSSPVGQDEDVKMHISAIKLAQVFENFLEVENYHLVTPYIRLAERADAQRQANAHQEQVGVEQQTNSGLTPDQFTGGMNAPQP